jgi:hypothetical protein
MWGTYKRVLKGKIMWGSKINSNKKQIHGGFFENRRDAHLRSVQLYESTTGTKWKSEIEKRLNPDSLSDVLSYDAETGNLIWKSVINRRRKDLVGQIAGLKHHSGYIHITFAGKEYAAHRVCFYLYHGYWPKNYIDHINGIRDDNRICNLRDVKKSLNAQNQKEHREGKLWGASWQKRSNNWMARFTHQGKQMYFGSYDTEEQAHKIAKQEFEKLTNKEGKE